jgi:hypothetical protein
MIKFDDTTRLDVPTCVGVAVAISLILWLVILRAVELYTV